MTIDPFRILVVDDRTEDASERLENVLQIVCEKLNLDFVKDERDVTELFGQLDVSELSDEIPELSVLNANSSFDNLVDVLKGGNILTAVIFDPNDDEGNWSKKAGRLSKNERDVLRKVDALLVDMDYSGGKTASADGAQLTSPILKRMGEQWVKERFAFFSNAGDDVADYSHIEERWFRRGDSESISNWIIGLWARKAAGFAGLQELGVSRHLHATLDRGAAEIAFHNFPSGREAIRGFRYDRESPKKTKRVIRETKECLEQLSRRLSESLSPQFQLERRLFEEVVRALHEECQVGELTDVDSMMSLWEKAINPVLVEYHSKVGSENYSAHPDHLKELFRVDVRRALNRCVKRAGESERRIDLITEIANPAGWVAQQDHYLPARMFESQISGWLRQGIWRGTPRAENVRITLQQFVPDHLPTSLAAPVLKTIVRFDWDGAPVADLAESKSHNEACKSFQECGALSYFTQEGWTKNFYHFIVISRRNSGPYVTVRFSDGAVQVVDGARLQYPGYSKIEFVEGPHCNSAFLILECIGKRSSNA